MNWEGKKVRYKTGKGGQGQGIGTVLYDAGDRVYIETANGKKITRSIGSILGPAEEEALAPELAQEPQLTAF